MGGKIYIGQTGILVFSSIRAIDWQPMGRMNTKINGKTDGAQKFGDKEKGRPIDIFEDITVRELLKIQ